VAELARRKADGRGLTTPELAVVIANVKNRFKRILSALPLTDETWAEPVLKPYFPSLLVETRSALDHPLANAILATVLANEVINRCGPLMIRNLAAEHGVDESAVILAWGQAWVALNLAPVFDALDADALTVPRDVSIKVDAQTRVLQQTMIAGVLSVPAEQLRGAGLAELTRLFGAESKRELLKAVGIKSEAALVPGLTPAFVQAWDAVDALDVVAGFLFPALFLQVGLALRSQAGIDTLERGLKLAAQGKSQEQLRNYAQQALRRTQQRLLTQVLARAEQGNAGQAVDAVTGALGLSAYVAATELEQAMLDVWTLSEAVNKITAKTPAEAAV
jgi:glutamate dehydrogenase